MPLRGQTLFWPLVPPLSLLNAGAVWLLPRSIGFGLIATLAFPLGMVEAIILARVLEAHHRKSAEELCRTTD